MIDENWNHALLIIMSKLIEESSFKL